MPQEFARHTRQTDRIAEAAYGESLLVHIGSHYVPSVYKALRNKPRIILISSRQYLPLAADVECSVVCVERTGEAFVAEKMIRKPIQKSNAPSGDIN
jgi:hypothetical protein